MIWLSVNSPWSYFMIWLSVNSPCSYFVPLASRTRKLLRTTCPALGPGLMTSCGAAYAAQLELHCQLVNFRSGTAQNRFLAKVRSQDQDIQQKKANLPSGQSYLAIYGPMYPILLLWSFQNKCLCLYEYPVLSHDVWFVTHSLSEIPCYPTLQVQNPQLVLYILLLCIFYIFRPK